MDPNLRATILAVGSVIGTVMTALAMNGKAALDALAGVPALLQAWSAGLPLGVGSFMLSLLLALLVWAAFMRKFQNSPRAPHVSADTVSVAVAIAVCLAQQWIGAPGQRGGILNAICLGAASGLIAPYIGRAIRAAFRKKPEPQP